MRQEGRIGIWFLLWISMREQFYPHLPVILLVEEFLYHVYMNIWRNVIMFWMKLMDDPSHSISFIPSFSTPDFQIHQFQLFPLFHSLSLLRASFTFRCWNSDTSHFIHFIRTISLDMNSQKSMLEFNVLRWFLVNKLSKTLFNGDELSPIERERERVSMRERILWIRSNSSKGWERVQGFFTKTIQRSMGRVREKYRTSEREMRLELESVPSLSMNYDTQTFGRE